MSYQCTVGILEHACELACKQKSITMNSLFMMMPALWFCFKNTDSMIVPSSFIEKISMEKDPIFKLITEFVNIIAKDVAEMHAEKARSSSK